jgi:predicted nucleotide-binding protein (sugar kinase/HSP70/actin superfamily)
MTVKSRGAGLPGSGHTLQGRTLWIPQMSRGGAMAFAAAFRAVGIDARICPDSDDRTLELGLRHTSGEECLPARVTLGNFLKVIEQPGFNPSHTAFFMPSADGPCRFGQYAPYMQKVLRDLGMDEARVFAPSSRDGYQGIGVQVDELMRNALRGLLCADILRKLLHRTRPYEIVAGSAEAAHARGIAAVEHVLEQPGVAGRARLRQLEAAMLAVRGDFRRLKVRHSRKRLFIGVVGEIFCRLTPFTNESIVLKIEALGGECALAHLVEWVWYTNVEHQKRLRRDGRRFSKAMVAAKLSDYLQHRDEHRLYRIFEDDFRGCEEPPIREILRLSQPYLPHTGALGEMTLSVGKAVSCYHQGCDAVVDVAPFTCMNGIVTEAVYPRVSADHDDIPLRNIFFDGARHDLDRDLSILVELARMYQARKKVHRVFPRGFPGPMPTAP